MLQKPEFSRTISQINPMSDNPSDTDCSLYKQFVCDSFIKTPSTHNLSLVLSLDNILFRADLEPNPDATTFLEQVSRKYEIIIFNKQSREDTRKLCEEIDPHSEHIKHILCEEHYERSGKRDLRKVGRPLTNLVAVETNVWSTCV